MRTPQLEKRYGNSLLIGRKTGWERRNDRVTGNLVGLRCDEGLPVSFYQYPNNLGRPLPEHFDIVVAKSSIAPSAAASNRGSYGTGSTSDKRGGNTVLKGQRSAATSSPLRRTGAAVRQSAPRQRSKNAAAAVSVAPKVAPTGLFLRRAGILGGLPAGPGLNARTTPRGRPYAPTCFLMRPSPDSARRTGGSAGRCLRRPDHLGQRRLLGGHQGPAG